MFIEIFILFVLTLINAFFSASEMALVTLNDNKIRLMAEEGDKKAQLLKTLLSEPGNFLATIQIGITLAGFLASAFAADSFSDRLAALIKLTGLPVSDSFLSKFSLILITVLLSYATLVLGELVPKRVAMKKAEAISMGVARPLTTLSRLASPFVKLLTVSTNFFVRLFGMDPNEETEDVTEEEIRMMVDVGEEKGAIHESEKQMINNVFEFDNKTASDIMTHRMDMAALPVEATLDEVIEFFNSEKYSRIPVYEEDVDNIIGVLHSKDLMQFITSGGTKEKFSLREIMREPYFVPASKRTDVLFKEMQRKKIHLVVIIDEYGGTAGIVTIEDLIEEIVGNIWDEYDDEEEDKDISAVDENTFIINGSADLEEVNEYLDSDLPTDEYETLNGFIIGQLGRIPGKDDHPTIEFNNLCFKVQEVEEKRIAKVKVCKV